MTRVSVDDLVETVERQADVFETSATAQWRAFRAWSDAVERRPQKLKFMANGVAKYRLAGRLIAQGLRQHALAVFRFVVEHLFPALRVDQGEGGKHQSRQDMGQGQILGRNRLNVRRGQAHLKSPVVGEPAGEAESPDRGTDPATKPEARA